MSEALVRLFAPNIITVCINHKENGDYSGEIWDQYATHSTAYTGLMDLVFRMDELYDSWNFPQRANKCRSFLREDNSEERTPSTPNIRKGKKMELHNVQEKRGKQGTFIVQVQYRQNSSWQGQVIWAEENKREHFRSALELMKLIDGAMSGSEEGMKDAENAS